MRKRNFLYYVDTVFWWVLYALPFISWLIMLSSDFTGSREFEAFLISNGFASNTFISDCLNAAIGVTSASGDPGVFPILPDTAVYCLSWFVSVFIAHLMVDFLLFIPRLAHSWMNDFLTKSE